MVTFSDTMLDSGHAGANSFCCQLYTDICYTDGFVTTMERTDTSWTCAKFIWQSKKENALRRLHKVPNGMKIDEMDLERHVVKASSNLGLLLKNSWYGFK